MRRCSKLSQTFSIMEAILFLVALVCAGQVQFTESKKYRVVLLDEVLEYELDKSVPSYLEYFSLEHFFIEQIDDDTFFCGGYIECIKSLDPNLIMKSSVRTQYYLNSRWYEGLAQLTQIDMCTDFRNPERFIYNITKLWTTCPPQKGDKLVVENHTAIITFDLPVLPAAIWKGFVKVYQGVPFYEKFMYGFGIKIELIQV